MSGGRADAPVFVAGIAGTGKTPMGQMLDRHSNIAVTRRTYLWREQYGRSGDLADSTNRTSAIESMMAAPGVQALGLDAEQVRREAAEARTYAELFAVVHRLHAAQQGKGRWCDQLGLVEAYAAPIMAAFPDATIIHMVRDPRAPRLSHRRPGELGWMLGKWLTSVELAERNHATYGDRYLVVRFEDLRDRPEATLRSVCDGLAETFEPAMVGVDPTAAADRVGAGAEGGVRFIESHAASPMARQGYAPSARAAGPGLRYGVIDYPANRVALAAWRGLKERAMTRQVEAGV